MLTGCITLQDGQVAHVKPILLTEIYGWCCWRFNLAVKALQQEQEVFYTIDADPHGKRYAAAVPAAPYLPSRQRLAIAAHLHSSVLVHQKIVCYLPISNNQLAVTTKLLPGHYPVDLLCYACGCRSHIVEP